jgi:hypothetical protein
MNIYKLSAVVVVASQVGIATAVTAFTNLGSLDQGGGATLNLGTGTINTLPLSQGSQFVSAATGVVSTQSVSLMQIAGQDSTTSTPTFDLYQDSGADTLGTLMTSFSGPGYSATTLRTMSAMSAATLTLGQKYWVVAREPNPASYFAWESGLGNPNGNHVLYVGTFGPFYGTSVQGGMRIETTPVPEPATLYALSLGILATMRRRKTAI